MFTTKAWANRDLPSDARNTSMSAQRASPHRNAFSIRRASSSSSDDPAPAFHFTDKNPSLTGFTPPTKVNSASRSRASSRTPSARARSAGGSSSTGKHCARGTPPAQTG